LIKLKLLNFHQKVVTTPAPENAKKVDSEYFKISQEWLQNMADEGEDVFADRFLTPSDLNEWLVELQTKFRTFHDCTPPDFESMSLSPPLTQ
jgi:hypothetical protein